MQSQPHEFQDESLVACQMSVYLHVIFQSHQQNDPYFYVDESSREVMPSQVPGISINSSVISLPHWYWRRSSPQGSTTLPMGYSKRRRKGSLSKVFEKIEGVISSREAQRRTLSLGFISYDRLPISMLQHESIEQRILNFTSLHDARIDKRRKNFAHEHNS